MPPSGTTLRCTARSQAARRVCGPEVPLCPEEFVSAGTGGAWDVRDGTALLPPRVIRRAKEIQKESCATVTAQTPAGTTRARGTLEMPCTAACNGTGRVKLISAQAPHEQGRGFAPPPRSRQHLPGQPGQAPARELMQNQEGCCSPRPQPEQQLQTQISTSHTENYLITANRGPASAALMHTFPLQICRSGAARQPRHGTPSPVLGVSTFLTPHYPLLLSGDFLHGV